MRSRLDLDSGYLTRILQRLTADELVTVGRNEADGRVRTARPTRAGRRERAELDRRSNRAAAAILEPLTARQRTTLVDAMASVERLLTASLVRVEPCDPEHPHARSSLDAYFAELDERFEVASTVDAARRMNRRRSAPRAGSSSSRRSTASRSAAVCFVFTSTAAGRSSTPS